MNKPTFSVIIPVYNAGRYLCRCVESIRMQTLPDFECILVDDGSTDGSGEACDKACADDKRFKVFHVENGGVSRARNIGLDNASGGWVAFCDSDDWYDERRLETAYGAATRERQDFVWSPMRIWTGGRQSGFWHAGIPGEYRAEDGIALSSRKYDIGHVINKIYKAELLDGIRFPEGVQMAEDLIFNIEVFFRNGRVYNDGTPTYNYEYRQDSLAHSEHGREKFMKLYAEFLRLQRRLKDCAAFAENLPKIDAFVKNVIHV